MLAIQYFGKGLNIAIICVVLVLLSIVAGTSSAQAEIFMSISGKVQDASTGKGISGVDVMAGGTANKQSFLATTDANGHYSMKIIPEGEYKINIVDIPAGYVMQPYAKTVNVVKGKNVVNANFELPLGGAVSGIIYKNDGVSPLSNASLFALTNKGISISSTDTNGKYTLSGLVPESTTKLRVFAYGYGMMVVDNVTITAGQVTANIVITLPSPTTGIKGIVSAHDAVGVPVASAYVIVTGVNGTGITTTDSNGNFAIQGLQEGIYEATIFKIGFAPQVSNIAISMGQITNQNFILMEQPLPVITGRTETEARDMITLNFKIDNEEYPYAGLQFNTMGTGGCGCINISFTAVTGVGVSIGHSWCKCYQQCGSTYCTSSYSVTSICACFGFGIGIGGQVQGCNSMPSSGYSNSFTGGIGMYSGTVSTSTGGTCIGGGAGPSTPFTITWCSCYDVVQPM